MGLTFAAAAEALQQVGAAIRAASADIYQKIGSVEDHLSKRINDQADAVLAQGKRLAEIERRFNGSEVSTIPKRVRDLETTVAALEGLALNPPRPAATPPHSSPLISVSLRREELQLLVGQCGDHLSETRAGYLIEVLRQSGGR